MTHIKKAVVLGTLVCGLALLDRSAVGQIDVSEPAVDLGESSSGNAFPGPELVPSGAGLVPVPPEPGPQPAANGADTIQQPTRQPGGFVGLVTQPLPPALAAHVGSKLNGGAGLFVASVVPDSPAEVAGLQRNDILVSYDETPLSSFAQLVELVRDDEPGDKVTFEIIRSGTPQQVQVTLVEAPLDIAEPAPVSARQFADPPGMAPVPEPSAPIAEPTVISNNDIYRFLYDARVPRPVQLAIANRAPYLMSNYRVVGLQYGLVGPGLYQGVAILADRQGNRYEFQAGGTLQAVKAQLIDQLLRLP